MADVVEVEQTNVSVVTDEDKNVVEFRYYGVNEQKVDELLAQVTDIQQTMDEVVAAVEAVGGTIGGATGPLQLEIDALEVVVAAQAGDIAAETAARQAADTVIGNDLAALDVELSALIAAEPPARDAAIAVETAARIAGDAAEASARTAAIAATNATVAGQASLITAIDAAQVALSASFTALDAEFDALSAEFATWSADFTDVQTAVTDEIAARAAADLLRPTKAGNEVITGRWNFPDLGIIFDEHTTSPATPATGKTAVYVKTNGRLYTKDDAGVETEYITAAGLSELVDDRVGTLLVAGNNIDITYDDGANTITIDVESLTSADIGDFAEAVDDRVASLITAGNNIDVTYNDGTNTFTIDVEDLTSADISDWNEAVDDRVNSLLVAGANITLTYDDGANTMTIASTASGGTATDSFWDALGDLAVGSGANTAARLPIGATGEVLTVVGGTAAWAPAPSGILSDGDKGDITVSSGTTVWTIDNGVVTYAKMQNVSDTDKLLGRSTAGAGVVEEIACTAAGRALLDDADAAAQRTTLGLGTAAQSNTGDFATAGHNHTGVYEPADATILKDADIGVTVQAYDAQLDSLAGLAYASNALKVIRVNAGETGFELSGAGNVTGPAASVADEIALFSGTTGKIIKRASTTGVLKATYGVISAAVAGTDYGRPDTLVATLASDQATGANTTPVTLTGLVWTFEANSIYFFDWRGRVSPAAATTGCGFQIDVTAAVTEISMQFFHQLANTGTLSGGHSISDDSSVGVSSGMPGTSTYPVTGFGMLRTGANSGTAQLRFRSETSAVTTAKAGMTLVVRKVA